MSLVKMDFKKVIRYGAGDRGNNSTHSTETSARLKFITNAIKKRNSHRCQTKFMVDPPLTRPNGRKCAEGYAPYSSLKKRLMEWRKLRSVGTQTSPFTCCPSHDCFNDQSTREGPPEVDINEMAKKLVVLHLQNCYRQGAENREMKKYFYWLIQQLKTFRSEEGFVKLLLNQVKFTEAECNGPWPFEIQRMGRQSSSLQGEGKNVSNYAMEEKHDAEKSSDDDSICLNGLPEESMDLSKHVQ